jgi:integrase
MGKSNKLSVKKVDAIVKRGLHSDGGGLFLQVSRTGHRSWVYRYHLHGKRRTMGLGGFPKVSLKQARELRDDAMKLRDGRIDPIVARGSMRQVADSRLSVMQALEEYIAVMEKEWKTARYPEQIRARLDSYVKPIIGHLPIADIQLAEIEQVLVPIWTNMRPTANRIRQHLEGAINWSIAKKVRTDQSNPAEVKRLQFSVSFADRKVKHYPSLPYSEAPRFLAALRQQHGVKAKALEFIMLNAVRVADVCGGGKMNSEPMKWSHVDMASQLWTVPDTKTGSVLAVPLSDPAMKLLGEMRHFKDPSSNYVFPGSVAGSVTSDATLRVLLRDMGMSGIATTHGMRATFRTWCSECTDYPKDVVEMALAHAQSELDAAYMRGSLLAKRRLLMQHWADFLEGRTHKGFGNTVVALHG